MKAIGDLALSTRERAILCVVLNHDGKAGPYADADSLPFFTRVYARTCLRKWRKNLIKEAQPIVDGLITKLA